MPRQTKFNISKGSFAKLWLAEDNLPQNMDAPEHISIYGQESNASTHRLACMNLALRCFEVDCSQENAAISQHELHTNLRAAYVEN